MRSRGCFGKKWIVSRVLDSKDAMQDGLSRTPCKIVVFLAVVGYVKG